MSVFNFTFLYYMTVLILSLITFLILYLRRAYRYWENRNVFSLPPSLPFGHFKSSILQKIPTYEEASRIYRKLKPTGKPYTGLYFFWEPSLLILDPEYCKLIMTIDMQYFNARIIYIEKPVKHEPLVEHLLNIGGQKWKFLRTKLSPTFTSGKMKAMFSILVKCSTDLNDILNIHSATGEPLDVKETMGKFTTDVISSCAFGIECNCQKDPDNFIRKFVKEIQICGTSVRVLLFRFLPSLFLNFGITLTPRKLNDFFMNLISDTIKYREKNNITRNDFLNLLMQLKSRGYLEDEETTGKRLIVY